MPTRSPICLPPTRRNKQRLYAAALNALVLAAVLLALHLWHPPIRIITRTNPRDGAAMVWVPAGKFRMGQSNWQRLCDAYHDGGWRRAFQVAKTGRRYFPAQSAHMVYLDGYWIYTTEVTVAQYRKFCRITGRQMPKIHSLWSKDDQPIVNITWADANAYAKWAGAALPTEAQWEKAARGTDGRVYPWGND